MCVSQEAPPTALLEKRASHRNTQHKCAVRVYGVQGDAIKKQPGILQDAGSPTAYTAYGHERKRP